jgi:hypothetical protein
MPGRSRSGRQTADGRPRSGRWTVAGKAFQPGGRANCQRIGNEYRPQTADGRPQNGRWTVDGGRWGAGFPDRQTGDGIAQEDDRWWKPQDGLSSLSEGGAQSGVFSLSAAEEKHKVGRRRQARQGAATLQARDGAGGRGGGRFCLIGAARRSQPVSLLGACAASDEGNIEEQGDQRGRSRI